MSELKFIVNGQEFDAATLKRITPKAAQKPKKESDEKWHKGWRVVGHKPGALEWARDARAHDLAHWAGLPEDKRKSAVASGEKEPKPWDEAEWRKNARLDAVRSKPYAVPEAANECAELARKAGWLDVQVIELKRGEE